MLPMLSALRLVWAISAHYSDDTRMAALLQRIAHSVCDRAQHSISTQARSWSWSILSLSCLLLWLHPQARHKAGREVSGMALAVTKAAKVLCQVSLAHSCDSAEM